MVEKLKKAEQAIQAADELSQGMAGIEETLVQVHEAIHNRQIVDALASRDLVLGLEEIQRLTNGLKQMYTELLGNENMPKAIDDIKKQVTEKKKQYDWMAKAQNAVNALRGITVPDELKGELERNLKEIERINEDQIDDRTTGNIENIDMLSQLFSTTGQVRKLELFLQLQKYYSLPLLAQGVFNNTASVIETKALPSPQVEETPVVASEQPMQEETAVQEAEQEEEVDDNTYGIVKLPSIVRNKGFKPKKFKSEIEGFRRASTALIFYQIIGFGCISENWMRIADADSGTNAIATAKFLEQKGYLQKYESETLGYFYTLSDTGVLVLKHADSKKYLESNNHSLKSYCPLSEKHMSDFVLTMEVETLFLAFEKEMESLAKAENHIFRDEGWLCVVGVMKKKNVFLQCLFVRNWNDTFENCLNDARNILADNVAKACVVLVDMDEEAARNKAERFVEMHGDAYDKKRIFYHVAGTDSLLSLVNEEELVLEEEETIEEQAVEEVLEAPQETSPQEPQEEPVVETTETTVEPEEESEEMRELPYEESTVDEVQLGADEIDAIIENAKGMLMDGKMYAATAYLYAGQVKYPQLRGYYGRLAYALNDPLKGCVYSSDRVIEIFGDETEDQKLMISAALRNYFGTDTLFDYSMEQLYNMVVATDEVKENASLGSLLFKLKEFRKENRYGIDRYADYREIERTHGESQLRAIQESARKCLGAYFEARKSESTGHARYMVTVRSIFRQGGDLYVYVENVAKDEREFMDMAADFLKEHFLEGDNVSSTVISQKKVEAYIDKHWYDAADHVNVARKTSKLMGSLRQNLISHVTNTVACIAEWIELASFLDTKNDDGYRSYQVIRSQLLCDVQDSIAAYEKDTSPTGKVLLHTLKGIEAKVNGTYDIRTKNNFYIPFLRNKAVTLDERLLPDLSWENDDLTILNPMERVKAHIESPMLSWEERIENWFDDDYGSCRLVEEFLENTENRELYDIADYETARENAIKDAQLQRREFEENLALADQYGRFYNSGDSTIEHILKVVDKHLNKAMETNNFSLYTSLLEAYHRKISHDAQSRAASITEELENVTSSLGYLRQRQQDYIERIKEMIRKQNYTVAEDMINHLANDEIEEYTLEAETDYLKEFMEDFDRYYDKAADLHRINYRAGARRDSNRAKTLIDNWPRSPQSIEKMTALLKSLGFDVDHMEPGQRINSIENYKVTLKKPTNGRRVNYHHPVWQFGSEAMEKGFVAAFLYGNNDLERIINKSIDLGDSNHVILFVNDRISMPDRKRMARKFKEKASRSATIVVDKVVATYLAMKMEESGVNSMLMEVTMPFSYAQPYIDNPSQNMPTEMFIGRKKELRDIEDIHGINILYGGRQLGKSALLKQAKRDINHNENGDRAVYLEVKGKDYAAVCQCLSEKLIQEGILEERQVTQDWDILGGYLNDVLSKGDIPYLLVLIDEADTFISSCESVNYQPFDVIKRVQETDRFKVVIAGLRNVVRLKQDIALGNNSVLAHFKALTVQPLQRAEAMELLERPLHYLGLRFAEDSQALVTLILASTNYFPGLIQLYCARLLEAMTRKDYAGYDEMDVPPYILSEDHIKRVLSEKHFKNDIREKFMITLKLDTDDYYMLIAQMCAYLYRHEDSRKGVTPREIQHLAKELGIGRIASLKEGQIYALMEEMRELNVFRQVSENHYTFSRYSFYQMMGSDDKIETALLEAADEA